MKKLTAFCTLVVMLLVILLSALPTSTALAKKDGGTVTVTIHNRTGGKITIDLVNQDGYHNDSTFEIGMFELSTSQGQYRYYASTPCGKQSGEFNLNVSKILYLSCASGSNEILLTKPTPHYCYGIYDYWDFTNGEYAYMGEHCQDTPGVTGDMILYNVPDPTGEFLGAAWFSESGAAVCAPEYGPAYYYPNCWN